MSRNTRIALASIVILAAVGVFSVTLAKALIFAPEDSEVPIAQVPLDTPPVTEIKEALPTRLLVPALGVNANVQYVGVNAKGNMAAPNNFVDAGWYKFGPRPGERGSAVLDGHVDNALGLDGVFKHLAELKPGDEILVQTASSTKVRFIVQEVATYPYTAVPVDKIFNRNDVSRLNLITCGGVWLPSIKTYDERVVVYSVRAD